MFALEKILGNRYANPLQDRFFFSRKRPLRVPKKLLLDEKLFYFNKVRTLEADIAIISNQSLALQ